MKLWGLESQSHWRHLFKTGVLRSASSYAAREYACGGQCDRFPYDWIRKEMTYRVRPPRARLFPIWTWRQWEGKAEIDLRTFRWHYPAGERSVRIELECPDDQVLFCDYGLWFYVLNHWYLPRSLADAAQFEESFPDHPWAIFKALRYDKPKFQQKVIQSWQRVFDLGWYSEGITSPPQKKSIIGWIWELRREWVISHTPFVGSSTLFKRAVRVTVVPLPGPHATER